MADRNAGQDDCEQLNNRVTNEVTAAAPERRERQRHHRCCASSSPSRLDAISSHLTDFRSREETRARTYQDRVQRMRTRIAVLERESRKLHESLREEQRMAMMDALTGIPNRAAYDDRIEEEHKRWKRFERPVSILAVGHRSLQGDQRCLRSQGRRQGAASHRPASRATRTRIRISWVATAAKSS